MTGKAQGTTYIIATSVEGFYRREKAAYRIAPGSRLRVIQLDYTQGTLMVGIKGN